MTDKSNPPFKERIDAARMKRDWAQQKLADKMGSARAPCPAIKSGTNEPTTASQ